MWPQPFSLLLVTILSQSFLALVSGHLMTFPFLSAWHNLLIFICLYLKPDFVPGSKFPFCRFGDANIVIFFDLLKNSLYFAAQRQPKDSDMNQTKWKPVPWIFFDLDDTIWNFSVNSEKALHKLYEISPILRKLFKDINEFIDIYHTHNYRLWDLYSRGLVTTRELKVERWRRTLATRQFEVLTAVCEELERNYLDILAEEREMIPGVTGMLQQLTKKCLIGVLSNGFSTTQYKKLNNSGLWRYVTRTIVSEEIGINKPDRRIFEYAIAETGAIMPCLMVGDHAETDVLGALKAGWKAIWFNPKGKPLPFSEDDLKELHINPDYFLGEAGTPEEILSLIFRALKE